MKNEVFNINIGPKEAVSLIDKEFTAAKIDTSEYEINDGKYIITTVYMANYTEALVIIIDNVENQWTRVKLVSAGMASGPVTGMTSEAISCRKPKGLIRKINEILKEYIVR